MRLKVLGAIIFGLLSTSAQEIQSTSNTPSARPPVHRPYSNWTQVTTCEAISTPGNYEVTQDLTTDTGACLTIYNTHDVILDCFGHTVSTTANNENGIFVYDVQTVTVTGCTSHAPKENDGVGLQVNDSQGVTIKANNFENLYVFASTGVYVANNQILGSYNEIGTSRAIVLNNTINFYTEAVGPGGVVSSNGAYNQILDNHIDGGWNGTSAFGTQGADDGIALYYEQNDEIEGNAIQNTWDAGIETIGPVFNTVIANNQIKNNLNTGIFATFNISWQNNVISGNQVQQSLTFMSVGFVASAVYGPIPSTLSFQNNLIENNVFTSPREADPSQYYVFDIELNNPQVRGQSIPLVAGNNTLRGNIMPTTMPGPILEPGSAFVDGGGNVCGPPPSGSPITCQN